jgi:crossover junction endodeoxyribonuclease RuvC
VIVLPARKPLVVRLGLIAAGVEALIEEHRPDRVVTEQIIFVRNVRAALALGQVRGAVVAACARAGLVVDEFGPTEIKKAVTGRGRAAKGEVSEMVRRLLGLPEVAQEDASDALAAALSLCLRGGGTLQEPRVVSGRGSTSGRKGWEALARERGLIK